MFKAEPIQVVDKTQHYQELAEQMRGLLSGERDRTANAANFSSLVFNSLPALNWAGFYFYDGHELVVGPLLRRRHLAHAAGLEVVDGLGRQQHDP